MLRIFLVDDNAMARAAIKESLQQHKDWVVVGEAVNGRQALEKIPQCTPELTVMDFVMPEMNGLEAARYLTERDPEARILMITTDPSSQLEEEARRAGIRGVCAKEALHRLKDAIHAVMLGGTYFGHQSSFGQESSA